METITHTYERPRTQRHDAWQFTHTNGATHQEVLKRAEELLRKLESKIEERSTDENRSEHWESPKTPQEEECNKELN